MSDWPDLASLELLVRVAETGSLGRAAREQGISQPAASGRLRALERRLGLALVVRSPAGSRVTDDGGLVTDWARRLLADAEALRSGAASLRERRNARLQVAASLTVAEHLVPGWLAALRGTGSTVQVGLRVANSATVIDAVRAGEAELGFVEGPALPTDLAQAAVGRDRLTVVVAPGHPWTRRSSPLRPVQLAATPLVLRETGSGTRAALEHALGHPVAVQLELGSNAAVRAAVAGGAGPAVLSALAVADEVTLGRLVEVPVSGLDLERVLHAVWSPQRPPGLPARELLRVATRVTP